MELTTIRIYKISFATGYGLGAFSGEHFINVIAGLKEVKDTLDDMVGECEAIEVCLGMIS